MWPTADSRVPDECSFGIESARQAGKVIIAITHKKSDAPQESFLRGVVVL